MTGRLGGTAAEGQIGCHEHGQKDFGIRDGEVAVDLPQSFDASLYYIGRIRTLEAAQDCPRNARIRRRLRHRARSPLGRWPQGVETCTHVVVLYWMDKSRRDLVLQVPGHYGVQRGTFALRSPARPNPIAMSVARLLKVDGNRLQIVGVDCLDNTPLIDLKPYFASTDAVADAVVGWHKAGKT